MRHYSIYHTWQGYHIQCTIDGKKFPIYLQSVYKGKYTFHGDYLYQKAFKNIKTAEKHIKILESKEK